MQYSCFSSRHPVDGPYPLITLSLIHPLDGFSTPEILINSLSLDCICTSLMILPSHSNNQNLYQELCAIIRSWWKKAPEHPAPRFGQTLSPNVGQTLGSPATKAWRIILCLVRLRIGSSTAWPPVFGSWWLNQPISKILVKMGISLGDNLNNIWVPQFLGVKVRKYYLSCHLVCLGDSFDRCVSFFLRKWGCFAVFTGHLVDVTWLRKYILDWDISY